MSDVQLPGTVRLEPGPGGLPVLRVDGPDGWAEIHLHGAQVTAWGPSGEPSALWLSPLSRFDGSAAVRGGVPLCFPWFGPLDGRPDAPRHGLGRTALWSLDTVRDAGGDVVLSMVMTDSAATRASAWPHPFRAVCTVVVGARLTVTLAFTHRGARRVLMAEALHTYLAVGDVTAAEVGGLEGVAFLDKTAGGATVEGEPDALRISGEVDRVYLDTHGPVTVQDEVGGRTLTMSKHASATTVVWNPWVDGAHATADIPDDGWRRFVCVEASNVGPAAVPLEPGATHELSTTIEVSTTVDLVPATRKA